jgi:hypothetical protein
MAHYSGCVVNVRTFLISSVFLVIHFIPFAVGAGKTLIWLVAPSQ